MAFGTGELAVGYRRRSCARRHDGSCQILTMAPNLSSTTGRTSHFTLSLLGTGRIVDVSFDNVDPRWSWAASAGRVHGSTLLDCWRLFATARFGDFTDAIVGALRHGARCLLCGRTPKLQHQATSRLRGGQPMSTVTACRLAAVRLCRWISLTQCPCIRAMLYWQSVLPELLRCTRLLGGARPHRGRRHPRSDLGLLRHVRAADMAAASQNSWLGVTRWPATASPWRSLMPRSHAGVGSESPENLTS